MSESIIVERKVRVGLITINRPEVKNAIDEATNIAFRKALWDLRANKKVRVIIITGTGNSFSAGQDLKSVYGLSKQKINEMTDLGRLNLLEICSGMDYDLNPTEFFENILSGGEFEWKIGENWKPVIAQVNGYALGGGTELACACDFRFASESASFGLPEINMRIFPAWGGTQYTRRVLGIPRAAFMVYTGLRITSSKAKELGLVHDVFKDEELGEKTMEFAKELAKKDPGALKLAKTLVEQANGISLLKGLAREHELALKWD